MLSQRTVSVYWPFWLGFLLTVSFLNLVALKDSLGIVEGGARLWMLASILIHSAGIVTLFLPFALWSARSRRGLKLLGASVGVFLLTYLFDSFVFFLQKFHLSAPISLSANGHFREWLSYAEFSGIPPTIPLTVGLALLLSAWAGARLGTLQTLREDLKGFWRFTPRQGVALVLLMGLLQLGEQWVTSRWMDIHAWKKQQETLWFYPPLFKARSARLALLDGKLLPPEEPEFKAIDPRRAAPPNQNLFIFVLETFRGDFITPEVTPRLHRFGQEEAIEFNETLANGNTTEQGWFTLFHGLYTPRSEGTGLIEQRQGQGSPFLRFLKQEGFNIHVYASSFIHYLRNSDLILGHGFRLAQDLFIQTKGPNWKNDQDVVDKLIRELRPQGKHATIVFLDSGHFPYHYPPDPPDPPDFQAPFQPSADLSQLAAAFNKNNVEAAKNRYKNAMHSVDTYWGRIEDALKERGIFQNAVIGITGDHGEEFFEHGHRGHGYHLTQEQIRVPILLKIPGAPKKLDSIATHVDVFPTLLAALGFQSSQKGLDGFNLLDRKRTTSLAFSRRIAFLDQTLYFALKTAEFKATGFVQPETGAPPKPRLRLTIESIQTSQDQPLYYSLSQTPQAQALLRDRFNLTLDEIRIADFYSTLPAVKP